MADKKDERSQRGAARPLDVEPDARWRTPGLDAEIEPRGVTVQEVMTRETVTATLDWSAGDAARAMRDHNVGFIPVCQSDGSPVGVVTDRDLVIHLMAEDLPSSTEVEEVMTHNPVVVHAGDDLAVAELLMQRNQISRLLVLDDDDTLAGVISLADLAQYEEECRVAQVLAEVTEREAEPH
jgi:CBS domain-containing protein